MKKLAIYIHGKGGTADEAEHFRPLFAGSDVVGLDYEARNPWEADAEFPQLFDACSRGYDEVVLMANSIGAFFAMSSLGNKRIAKALFVSPVVNMEKLITDMIKWAGVTEEELESKREIPTEWGETLSWEYLSYVREHPVRWYIPTFILYGEKDDLTSPATIAEFSERIGADLTVMKEGEHWFHTQEQMKFLDEWVQEILS